MREVQTLLCGQITGSSIASNLLTASPEGPITVHDLRTDRDHTTGILTRAICSYTPTHNVLQDLRVGRQDQAVSAFILAVKAFSQSHLSGSFQDVPYLKRPTALLLGYTASDRICSFTYVTGSNVVDCLHRILTS
jgi:hypothetical protein